MPSRPRSDRRGVTAVVGSFLLALALTTLGGTGAWLVHTLGGGAPAAQPMDLLWPVALWLGGWAALWLAWTVLRPRPPDTPTLPAMPRDDTAAAQGRERAPAPLPSTPPAGLPPGNVASPATAVADSASALGHPLFTPVVLRLADALPGRSLLVRREQLDSPWLLVHVHAPASGVPGGGAHPQPMAGPPGRAAWTQAGSTQAGPPDLTNEPAPDTKARVSTTLTPPYPQLASWLADHHDWQADAIVAALSGDGHELQGQPAEARVLPLDAYAAIVWIDPAEAVAQLADKERESFVYTVSHDLRAPIRVIEGFTRIIKEDHGPSLDRIGNDHLDRVLGAAARMTSMIDALLTLSRLSTRPLACEPVDLSALAAQVIDELRRQTPDRRAEATITPDLIVTGDATLLRSMLDNLIGNAWKYCARRELTRIEFGLHHDQGLTHGGQRVFCVRDNGAGFDMRFADRLFGPFQRLHSASEFAGTGVGLASVRRIVRRHGGEIWAEAQVDRGASFYFTLT
ncbi:MAG: hypothetical protein RL375_4334 [Pseudomonadota bacterium]